MTTVIDELLIKLSLDSSNFTKGQQQTVQSLRKMEDEARSAGKGTEEAAEKMVDGFKRVTTEVLGLGAAFLGVNGLKDLVVSTTKAASSLNIQSHALNINSDALNRWQNAARYVGISADQSGSAISNLVTKLQQFRTGQIGPEGIGQRALAALGINNPDLTNWEHFLKQVQSGVLAHPEVSAGLVSEIPGADSLLPLLQRRDLNALLERSLTITKDEATAATEVANEWTRAQIAVEKKVNAQLLGRTGVRAQLAIPKAINALDAGDPATALDELGPLSSFIPGLGAFYGVRRLGQRSGIGLKSDVGNFTPGTAALAEWLGANVPGFNRITAADDAYHGGRGGHGAGLALDFTIKGGATEYALVAEGLRRKGLNVINEFAPGSSPGWTAPHLHAQFKNQREADEFARGHPGLGSKSTTVGTINVYTQPGADPHAIGAAVRDAVSSPEAESGAH